MSEELKKQGDTKDEVHGAGEQAGPVVQSDDLVYRGKTVIRHQNKLIHGNRYIEVDCASEVYTLTPEEFEAEVLPRNA